MFSYLVMLVCCFISSFIRGWIVGGGDETDTLGSMDSQVYPVV